MAMAVIIYRDSAKSGAIRLNRCVHSTEVLLLLSRHEHKLVMNEISIKSKHNNENR